MDDIKSILKIALKVATDGVLAEARRGDESEDFCLGKCAGINEMLKCVLVVLDASAAAPAAPIAEVTNVTLDLSKLQQWEWDYSGMDQATVLDDELRYYCVADVSALFHPAAEHAKPNPIVLDGPIGEIVARCPEADAYMTKHMAEHAKPEPVVMGVAQDENPVAHAKQVEGASEYEKCAAAWATESGGKDFESLGYRYWLGWQARGQQAGAVDRAPSGYAYRYHDEIRFGTGGRSINGSYPIETIPYWLGEPAPKPAGAVDGEAG